MLTFYLLVNRKFKAIFFNKSWEGANVNISYECNFSEVHCGMNRRGSRAKFTLAPSGLNPFACDPLRLIP